jgi:hypothetical protein
VVLVVFNCIYQKEPKVYGHNVDIHEFLYSQQGHEVSSSDPLVSPAGGLLSTALAVLTGSPISLDISCQQWLIQLAGNLFSGMSLLYRAFTFT